MKAGEIITASTHAEFLNDLLGTSYKQYMRCTFKYGSYVLWMIRLNGTQSNTGWTNELSISKDEIREFYTGNPHDRLENHKDRVDNQKRLVFDILESSYGRKYIFRGVFVFDKRSDNDNRIWRKTANEFSF